MLERKKASTFVGIDARFHQGKFVVGAAASDILTQGERRWGIYDETGDTTCMQMIEEEKLQ